MSANILYMIDRLTLGGTERQLMRLVENLDRERFTPHLCTLGESDLELDVPAIQLAFGSFRSPRTLIELQRLASFIREREIAIVQTFFQDPFVLGAMVRPLVNVKLVGSFRDLGFWRTPAESIKMRMAAPFFSGFVANSEAVKTAFSRSDWISPGRIEVIYNGIDLAGIEPREHSVGGAPVVGIVANLNRPVKRVQDFIEAAARVKSAYPEARFMIIGDGHLRAELEQLCRERKIEDAVQFIGRVSDPGVYIREFDVGVITSETEGFCNAIIEYMAHGLPVIATDTGGNPELVTEGENGFLVPAGDPDRLADRIMRLLGDREAAAAIGQVNAAKIRAQFTLDTMIERQSAYYDRLLST